MTHRIMKPKRWKNIDVKSAWANWRVYRANTGSFIFDLKLPYEMVMWFILYGGILKTAWGIDLSGYLWEFAISATVFYIALFWIVGQIGWVKELEEESAKSQRKHADPENEEHMQITREIHRRLFK